jgi:hypothetical protein
MRRIAAKFVPQHLTNEQKQRHINVCLELQEKANEDKTFISRIITGDESWIYGYDYATIVAVEEPTITKSRKDAAGPEFNKEHAHCFLREEDCSR